MSSDFVPISMTPRFCDIFYGKWKLSNLLNYEKKKLISPPFFPVFDSDAKFCFELWFSEYTSDGIQNSMFKLVLAKLDGVNLQDSLQLEIEGKIQYLNSTVVKEYAEIPYITVNNLDYYHFDAIHHPYIFKINNKLTPFGIRLSKDSSLLLKCRMLFFDKLTEMSNSVRIVSSLEPSPDDNKSFKRFDEFSNIIVRVDHRVFLSHKAVLSRHSSVLKQKITQISGVLVLDDDKMGDAFDKFLDYLYSGDFEDMPFPMVKDVYALSAKYKVDELKKKCADAMLSHLSVGTVCEVLKMAHNFKDLHLYEPSIQFAADHTDELFSSEEERKQFYSSNFKIGCDLSIRFIKRISSLKSPL